MRMTSRPAVLSVAAWLLGAGAAITIGMQSLSAIGADLAVDTAQPLPADPVGPMEPVEPVAPTAPARGGPDAGPAPSPTRSTRSPQASTPARAAGRVVSTTGGTAIVRCQGDRAYLVSWSPHQGYRTTGITRGPAETVRVTFSSEDHKVEVEVGCVAGAPRPRVELEDPDEDEDR